MTFNKRLNVGTAGQADSYLRSTVLGMGWISSVGLAQYLHREMILRDEPQGASLSPNREWRKDIGFSPDVVQGNFKVYLDNFDDVELMPMGDNVALDSLSPWQVSVGESYEYWNVPRNDKKSLERVSVGETQGALIFGNQGIIVPKHT